MIKFLSWLADILVNLYHDPHMTVPNELPMNQEPPVKQSETPVPAPQTPPALLWDTKANCRHSVRVICDQEGLTVREKNDLSATVHCESEYDPKATNKNIVNGHLSSTDFGICQINDYWHIGTGKDFPSVDFVLNNPEACVRWMCKMWKEGQARAWVCYSRGMYMNYTP